MKSFKSIEEIIAFVSDHENIETLDNGEVTLKDWNEDAKALKKYWKQHGQTTNDKKERDNQMEELSQRVGKLTEQLDSAYDELAGLKAIHSGDDKEMLQRLNTDLVAIKAKNVLLERQVATIPDLKRKVDEWNAARILEAVKKAAVARKVPQNIIDDPIFFEKAIVDEFTIDDLGNIFTKGDYPQTVDNFIIAMQRDRPHWQPLPSDSNVSDELAAIASLFSQSGSSGKHAQPVSGCARMTDEQSAIAALFR